MRGFDKPVSFMIIRFSTGKHHQSYCSRMYDDSSGYIHNEFPQARPTSLPISSSSGIDIQFIECKNLIVRFFIVRFLNFPSVHL